MMAWNWNLSCGLQLQHKLGSFPFRLFHFDENSSFPFLIPACNKNKTMDEIRSNPLLLTNPSLVTARPKPSHPGARGQDPGKSGRPCTKIERPARQQFCS